MRFKPYKGKSKYETCPQSVAGKKCFKPYKGKSKSTLATVTRLIAEQFQTL